MATIAGSSFSMTELGDGVSFSAFLLGLAQTALVHLGATPSPDSGQVEKNLMLARQTIGLIELLREKSKGNLTDDEEQLFAAMLTDLRLKYVAASK